MPIDPDVQTAIDALKADNAALHAENATLKNQQGLQTQALRRTLENNLEGAGGAAADVVALEGGKTSIVVQLGKGVPQQP